jgi:hypothetical protein
VPEVWPAGPDEEGGGPERGERSWRRLKSAVDGEENLGRADDRVGGFRFDPLLQESEQLVDDRGLLLDALIAADVAEQATDLVREELGEPRGGVRFVEVVGLRASRWARRRAVRSES